MRDLIGLRFERLTVVAASDRKKHFDCLCDCGNKKTVRNDHLLGKKIQSCGCLRNEASSQRTKNLHLANTTHGLSRTKLHYIWNNIKQRCHNPKHKFFQFYGGRGITVCKKWRDSFEEFLSDMGQPQVGQTLDRKDNSRGYSPSNCRWASRKEQSNNTRRNRIIEIDGVSRTLGEWADLNGLHRNTIEGRLKSGWPPKQAVSLPAIKKN